MLLVFTTNEGAHVATSAWTASEALIEGEGVNIGYLTPSGGFDHLPARTDHHWIDCTMEEFLRFLHERTAGGFCRLSYLPDTLTFWRSKAKRFYVPLSERAEEPT